MDREPKIAALKLNNDSYRSDFDDLSQCNSLRVLALQNCALASLSTFPDLPKLQQLNIGEKKTQRWAGRAKSLC
jgi:hypothetical protein